MLLPKLPYNQKPKLILQQKPINKPAEHQFHPNGLNTEKQNVFTQPNKNQQAKQRKLRSLSSSTKSRIDFSRESLQSKKKDLVEKQNNQNLKTRMSFRKSASKPILRLSSAVVKTQSPQSQSNNTLSSENFQKIGRGKLILKDQILEISIQSNQKHFQRSRFSSSTSKTHENSLESSNQFIQASRTDYQEELQKEHLFADFQNAKLTAKSELPFRSVKRTSNVRSSRKYSRIIVNKSLSFQYTVFSLQIKPEPSPKPVLTRKQLLFEELAQDPDFEWKFQKYNRYAKRYSEYEVDLKQKFSTLQFLTENLELIKQRITPFKSFQSLKDIVQILKPTLSKKEEDAHQIKMQMLEWKKKFFTNVMRIKQNFNKTVQQKYESVFYRLNENEDGVYKIWQLLDKMIKDETELYRKQDFKNLQKLIEPMRLNQKQIVDEIKMCERDSELLLEKFNMIEEEWAHTFDIFNSTLENCVNKCFLLSQLIEKFYGKSSNSSFLTNGMKMENEKDGKLLQNDNCHICSWNKIKLQKIIQENSLAKDHLKALKHLIAN